MISAVALGLLPVAEVHIALWQTVLWMLIGVGVFLLGDYVVDKRFAGEGAGEAMGIVVGSVVDGVPESLIFGIQIGIGATISPAFLGRRVRLDHPAGHRPFCGPGHSRLGSGEARAPMAAGRAGLWPGDRPRIPPHHELLVGGRVRPADGVRAADLPVDAQHQQQARRPRDQFRRLRRPVLRSDSPGW